MKTVRVVFLLKCGRDLCVRGQWLAGLGGEADDDETINLDVGW
jgi:hypothetical protein